jgi:hypothetical protein
MKIVERNDDIGYYVIDDFVSQEDWKNILDTMTSNTFPWFSSELLPYDLRPEYLTDQENLYWTHLFYSHFEPKSPHINLITPLINEINPIAIVRIKANFTIPQKPTVAGFHIDDSFNGKTAVYYLNTNNGKTVFKNGIEVDSVANRLLVFDSKLEHSPVFSTDKNRMIINFNYIEKNIKK